MTSEEFKYLAAGDFIRHEEEGITSSIKCMIAARTQIGEPVIVWWDKHQDQIHWTTITEEAIGHWLLEAKAQYTMNSGGG